MLAYVVLFGIVMVLMGCGLLVIMSMKKEEEEYQVEQRQYYPPESTLVAGGAFQQQQQRYSPQQAQRQPRQGPASRGDSFQGRLNSIKGNPITPNSGGVVPAAGTGQLCPELSGAVVPAGAKFALTVPILLHRNTEEDYAIDRKVLAKDGTSMFNLKITHSKPLPGKPEEYIMLSIPEEDRRELVLCAFGRPSGELECHIYQLGKEPWGVIKADPVEGSYTVYLRNSKPALTATVTGTDASRRVRIVQSQSPDTDVAIASAKFDGAEYSSYEVECYPLCDIILAIIMITGVDRMSLMAHR